MREQSRPTVDYAGSFDANGKRRTAMMVLVAAFVTTHATAGTYYEVTTLDTPFGSKGTTALTGVNNRGEVVGNYAGPDGDYNGPYPHAFQWRDGTYTQITNATSIWGINDAGTAVGLKADYTGLVHDIHTGNQNSFLVPGTSLTRIEGINNSGKVVGVCASGLGGGAFITDYTTPALAQVWSHPYVNHRNESTAAYGIDNLGRISGHVDAPYDIEPAKPYYIGGFITGDPASTSAFTNFNFGAADTYVTASNTNGVIVGWYYSGGGWTTGFVSKNGTTESYLVELPRVISTQIWDVNDLGWLAGSYVQLNEYSQPISHGFLAVPMTPKPIRLEMQKAQNELIFVWYSKAFTLQCGTDIGGVFTFTNIPSATSPWTNSTAGNRLYFRLVAN